MKEGVFSVFNEKQKFSIRMGMVIKFWLTKGRKMLITVFSALKVICLLRLKCKETHSGNSREGNFAINDTCFLAR